MEMAGFVGWLIVSVAFIGLGIFAFISKKEVAFSFWANAKMFPVVEAIVAMIIYVTVIEKKYRKK